MFCISCFSVGWIQGWDSMCCHAHCICWKMLLESQDSSIALRYNQSGCIWFCVKPRSLHNLNSLKFSWFSSFKASGRCWKTRGFILGVVVLFILLWCLEFQSQTLCSVALQRETKKDLLASESFKFFIRRQGSAQITVHKRPHEVIPVSVSSAASQLWSILMKALYAHRYAVLRDWLLFLYNFNQTPSLERR